MPKNNIYILLIILPISLFTVSSACLSEEITNEVRAAKLIKESKLMVKPSFKSDVVALVQANKAVNIQTRERAWYLVTVNASTKATETETQNSDNNFTVQETFSGWVNMLNVRFLATEKRQGELGVGALIKTAISKTLPTVSTGVRGFEVDDLKKAKADFKQLEQLAAYQVSAESVTAFAKEGKLKQLALASTEQGANE